MDFEGEFGGEDFGKDIPNYWEKFRDYKLGDLKDAVKDIFQKDPAGLLFKPWLIKHAKTIMTSYIWGLTHGVKASSRMTLDDFTTFIYAMETGKTKKDETVKEQDLNPAPMDVPKNELDTLFDENKIQGEIDDILGTSSDSDI